jgi:hypothetical protein
MILYAGLYIAASLLIIWVGLTVGWTFGRVAAFAVTLPTRLLLRRLARSSRLRSAGGAAAVPTTDADARASWLVLLIAFVALGLACVAMTLASRVVMEVAHTVVAAAWFVGLATGALNSVGDTIRLCRASPDVAHALATT